MRDNLDKRESRWARLKTFGAVVMVAFVVTLAVVVGNRLSEEALGVLAGAACGVSAAIPTSLIVVAVSRRQGGSRAAGAERLRERERSYDTRHPYPPVVVVSPGPSQPSSRSSWNALPASVSAGMDRDFRIVGGASMEQEGIRYDHERRA